MLVDTGAWNNLVGSDWVHRMDKINSSTGKEPSVKTQLKHPIRLGGVGKNTQVGTHSVKVPTTVCGDNSAYMATVIEGSKLPALLGLKTLKSMNAILDLRSKRVILPNTPEDASISYTSNSRVIKMEQAPGGFLMIPCSPTTMRAEGTRDKVDS